MIKRTAFFICILLSNISNAYSDHYDYYSNDCYGCVHYEWEDHHRDYSTYIDDRVHYDLEERNQLERQRQYKEDLDRIRSEPYEYQKDMEFRKNLR